MHRDNPLFQDSTISTGTNIRTQFEVSKVCLHDGESLCMLLSYDNEQKFLNMKSIDFKTGTYACSHWLKHRQEISYQFVLRSKEGVVFKSPIQQAFAMYTLLETWEPWDEEEKGELALLSDFDNQDLEEEGLQDSDANMDEPEDVIGNLIDKWGL